MYSINHFEFFIDMSKSKYIKVELKDGTKHILLAANEAFYKKQGAKITEPTQKEIEAAFPNERVATPFEEKMVPGIVAEKIKVSAETDKATEPPAETGVEIEAEEAKTPKKKNK